MVADDSDSTSAADSLLPTCRSKALGVEILGAFEYLGLRHLGGMGIKAATGRPTAGSNTNLVRSGLMDTKSITRPLTGRY